MYNKVVKTTFVLKITKRRIGIEMLNFSKEKFDIIIQAGQSNAQGTGIGAVEKEYCPTDKVYYLNSEKTVDVVESGLKIEFAGAPFQIEIAQECPVNGELTGDFSLTFAENYIKQGLLKEDRKILIVRAAIGGTGFFKKHWGLEDILYLKMLEMVDHALGLNPENKVVAFLWHQGEHDAVEGNTASRYYEQLSTLLKSVRARYGAEIPFIAGDFVNEWKMKNIEACEPIVGAIKKVVKDTPLCAFVETSDLLSNNQKTSNGDDIHFCRQALHVLGARYFDAFLRCQ